MEGKVLHYDNADSQGIIRGENGERFEFTDQDWKSDSKPQVGANVDFEVEGKIASEIYAVTTPGAAGNFREKVSQFNESDVGQQISALFNHGLHNKMGVIASLAVLVSLFLPVIEIPFLGSGSLINAGTGKLLFVLLIVLTIFFYGGATRLYTRILGGVVLGILFLLYYDFFSGLSQANSFAGSLGGQSSGLGFFELVQWGAFVNIIASVVLFIAVFTKEYTNNKNAI